MGQVCKRPQKIQTLKVPIRPKIKSRIDEELEEDQDIPLQQKQLQIGHQFQFNVESQSKQIMDKKKNEWKSILEDKLDEFKNVEGYSKIKNNHFVPNIEQSTPPPEVTNPKEDIIDFIGLAAQNEDNQSQSQGEDSPHRQSQPSQTNSQSKKLNTQVTRSNQEKLLDDIFINRTSHLKQEQEILLYIFSCQQPLRFRELLRFGIPYQYRWTCWKVRFYDEYEYDPILYEHLLTLDFPSQDQIEKDINRTFPKIKYFQVDEFTGMQVILYPINIIGQSTGQTQLFRVLKALSINFIKVGYCQGMNFIVGFLLLTNGGHEEEVFWLLKSMCENSEFLMTGIFESGFPLHNILIDLFRNRFKREMPELHEHFENQSIPESLYITKWVLTFFIYSFPFDTIYRFWDFILSNTVLSVVSLSLAVFENYEQMFLVYDVGDFANFLSSMHESKLLADKSHEHFLDVEKILQLAHTKYQISQDELDQLEVNSSNSYLSAIKKIKTVNSVKNRAKRSTSLKNNSTLLKIQNNSICIEHLG